MSTEVPLKNLTCRVQPLAHIPPYIAQDAPSRPQDLQFVVNFENTTLEFNGSDIDIFSTYQKRGVRTQYRREYIQLRLSSLTEEYSINGLPTKRYTTWNVPKWASFSWANATRLHVNSTKFNNITTELIFDFIGATSLRDSRIKFSFVVYSTLKPRPKSQLP